MERSKKIGKKSFDSYLNKYLKNEQKENKNTF